MPRVLSSESAKSIRMECSPSIAYLPLIAAHGVSILNYNSAAFRDWPTASLTANNLSRGLRLCRRGIGPCPFLPFALRFFALRRRLLGFDLHASIVVTEFVTSPARNPGAAITVRSKPIFANQRAHARRLGLDRIK